RIGLCVLAVLLGCEPTTAPGPGTSPPSPFEPVTPTVDLSGATDWLRRNAVTLERITPVLDGSDQFADLRPLATAIGDARVVVLGEQSHGDGTTFLMKARLVEFLHREMGFDVLAFESGLYSMD